MTARALRPHHEIVTYFSRADGRTCLAAVLLAVGAYLAYVAWLSWEHVFQIDPATGRYGGPYEAWQVMGCAATLAVLVLAVGAFHHPVLALVIVPIIFTVTWSIPAARYDVTGLWLVGAFLVLMGTATGTAALAFAADALRSRMRA